MGAASLARFLPPLLFLVPGVSPLKTDIVNVFKILL